MDKVKVLETIRRLITIGKRRIRNRHCFLASGSLSCREIFAAYEVTGNIDYKNNIQKAWAEKKSMERNTFLY